MGGRSNRAGQQRVEPDERAMVTEARARSLTAVFGGQPRGRTRGRGPEDLAWGRGRGIIGHADVYA